MGAWETGHKLMCCGVLYAMCQICVLCAKVSVYLQVSLPCILQCLHTLSSFQRMSDCECFFVSVVLVCVCK